MPETTTDFEAITIGLASPEDIHSWSYGEVKKPETINYRTYKPERDGLFCERIFGPTKDWECHCGKYKKVKFKGITCDRCGVEVTRSKVRRERMGHIDLAAPVCHSWYLKGVPSPISLLLDMSRRLLEEVVYFASYIVIDVDADRLQREREDIMSAVEAEKEEISDQCDLVLDRLREKYEQGLKKQDEEDEESEESEQTTVEHDEGEIDDTDEDEIDELLKNDESIEAEAGLDFEFPGIGDTVEPLPEVMTEEDLSHRIQLEKEAAQERIEDLEEASQQLFELAPRQLISEVEYRKLEDLMDVCEKHLEGRYSDLFNAGLGAEAIHDLLEKVELDELARELRKEIDERTGARRSRAVKRLRVVEAFRKSKNRPEWMVLDAVPVLPPELRPMVQLDGGRFATSDLNDLYRRVINRNNRLRRIMEINAPESIINHERRLLQEAVDALIDNNRRSRPVTGTNRRQLKSLSDMLKGKEGRFRKNLLGKRVDYSGRSVIVVGPELEMHQCGVPREMARELFKPFVMQRLVELDHTSNIKTAKRMVDRPGAKVWDALEDVIEDHPVLLNRAPTLHRLGIQAYEPVLTEGKAIQLHPLSCEAFNADFDGDQMAVHVPLSAHAQAESRLLMLSSRNLFKPANGQPITSPKYDMVLGAYYLTQANPDAPGSGKTFESSEAVISAYEHKKIDLHATIHVRVPKIWVSVLDGEDEQPKELEALLQADLERSVATSVTDEHPVRERQFEFTITEDMLEGKEELLELWKLPGMRQQVPEDIPQQTSERIEALLKHYAAVGVLQGECVLGDRVRAGVEREIIQTTVGRVLFNSYLPLDMQFIDHEVAKNELAELSDECFERYGRKRTVQLLDALKEAGFKFATRSGLSISIDDTDVKSGKEKLLEETEAEVREINEAAAEGHVTAEEREQLVLEQWLRAREKIADQILDNFDQFNSVWMMSDSGARANRSHISQVSGMRGLMTDPFGSLIEDMPVKNSFNDGLNVLEYFVSTHGARKGLADTALRTADAGYLTRRLVDVAQDVMILAEDCGTMDGITVYPFYEHELHCPACGQEDHHREGVCQYCGHELPEAPGDEKFETLEERIVGRTAAVDVMHPETGEVLVSSGKEIQERDAKEIVAADIREVNIRSPLTCELPRGVCAKCYGRDLATRAPVELGTAIGIIAAQSIGEPGTQLTMRTFHTGGVAAEYITGVADVKKRKQQALRSLSEDIDQGLVSLEAVAGGGRARRRAIKEMLKVLESSVHGLLRVVELFEARTPKGQAITADVDGVVAEIDTRGLRTVVIHSEHPLADVKTIRGERLAHDVKGPDGETIIARKGEKLLKKVRQRLKKAGRETVTIATSHLVPYRGELYVQEGTEVRAGDRLTAGPMDPETLLEMKGVRGLQNYLLREIQSVYKAQGVDINDRHMEVIIRQMLHKRRIIDHGDTRFLPGQLVDRLDFEAENRRVQELGGTEATAEPVLLGITQASLATDSFLSAASFQRTTRVLTEAAYEHKRDPLLGLKENVIIGRLIPAGSGLPQHRKRQIDYSPEAEEAMQQRAAGEEAEGRDALEQLLEEIQAAREAGLSVLDSEGPQDEEETDEDSQDEVEDEKEESENDDEENNEKTGE